MRQNKSAKSAPRSIHGLIPALAFLALALLWIQVGYLTPGLSRPLGGLIWLITLLLVSGKYRWIWLTLGAVLLFGPWGAVVNGNGLWLLALLPWAGAAWGRRWMGAAFLAAAGGFLWQYFPGLWVPGDDLVSGFAHGLSGADLSISASGLPVFLLAACFPLMALITERRFFAPLITLGGLVAVLLIYWLLQRNLESLLHGWGWHFSQDAFSMQWILLGLLGLVLVFWGVLDPPKPSLPSDKPWRWLAPGLALVGVLLFGWPANMGKPAQNKQIVFLNKGYLNWDKPHYGNYGAHSSGMFGLIPDYLRWRGFQVSLKDSLSPNVLDSAGVLVIVNLMDPLNSSEEEALRRFVEKGGSLLLLGDHTGLANIRDPSNRIISPYGIELNFDTAKPLRTGWAGSLICAPHPLTQGRGIDRFSAKEAEALTQIWVGASLKVAAPARPVIVGRDTWSDAGNLKNERDGYLGDFRYRIDERLGNQVLVAEAHHGRGKVLVFGDTSTLQNGALVRAGDWVVGLFTYLLSPTSSPSRFLITLGALMLIASLVVWGLSGASYAGLAFCSLALFFAGSFIQARVAKHETPTVAAWTASAPPRALLDHSHAPRTPLNQVSESGHWGLQNALMRSGFLPRIIERWDPKELDQAQILVEIAPSKSFSRAEMATMTRFMERGGLVIISCGMEEFDGSRGLLTTVGLQPVYVPLGPAEIDTVFTLPSAEDTLALEIEQKVKVVFHEGWDVKIANPNVRSMLDGYGKPLVVFAPVGEGGLLYIPDTDFLMNRNLESTTNKYYEGNILFLRYLLRELVKGV